MSPSKSAVDKLVKLAKDQFGDDFDSGGTGVDTKFFTAMADGTFADYRVYKDGEDPEKDPENYPANAKDWGPERALQADRIEWLCTDKDAAVLVSRKGIKILGARIDGELDLDEVRLDRSLSFWHCAFVQPPIFSDASFSALYLPGTHCPGIRAHRLHLEGNLHLDQGFVATGEVNLLAASIGGQLTCSAAKFLNKDGMAFDANAITVSAGVFLSHRFRAEGQIDLGGASIGGQLVCANGTFLNEGKKALSAHAITVKGDVLLCALETGGEAGQPPSFRVEGILDFTRANIQGALKYLHVEEPEKAALDLRHAKVGILWDDPESWPEPGKLWLRGFEYEALADKATVDADERLDWLSRDAGEDFSPQPYEQLAKVLSRSGYRRVARLIRIEKERRLAKQDRARHRYRSWSRTFGLGRRVWNLILGELSDYGYRPWKLLPVGAAIVLIGWALYDIGYALEWVTPTRVHTTVEPYKDDPALYPTFHGLAYSLDALIPALDLEQVDYWLPNASRGPRLELVGPYYVSWSGCLLFFCYWQAWTGWGLALVTPWIIKRIFERED